MTKMIIPLVLIFGILLIVPVQPVQAKLNIFYISALDEYGQGISPSGIDVFENSTGSWQYVDPFGGIPDPLNCTYGNFLKFRIETRMNSTLTGATDLTDGKNYFRHNLTVTIYDGSTVFSQENFTYHNSADVSGIYYYSYEVILNFAVQVGFVYSCYITYEIFGSWLD